MQQRNIPGASRGKAFETSVRDKEARPASDLENRNFTTTALDELWVPDITAVPRLTGSLFLAIVLDEFSRSVVGWSMETHMRAELVVNALKMAVNNVNLKNVIHRSDEGSQYTTIAEAVSICGENVYGGAIALR